MKLQHSTLSKTGNKLKKVLEDTLSVIIFSFFFINSCIYSMTSDDVIALKKWKHAWVLLLLLVNSIQ